MDFLPVFLRSQDKPVVVYGDGLAVTKKMRLLQRSGCHILLYTENPQPVLLDFIEEQELTYETRRPEVKDFQAGLVTVIASENKQVNQELAIIATEAGVCKNVIDDQDACDFIMPATVDRSPVIIAVSTSGATPVLARLLRSRIETAIPATYGRLASFAAQFRTKLKATVTNSRSRYRFWESLIHGVVAEKVLAGKDAEAQILAEELMRQVSESDDEINQGEVYLVGAGPGDPDLLTFKALRLMQQADVVLYDRLIGEGILNMVRHEAERIYVGKMKNDHAVPQEEISALLVRLAKQGKRVLRLKGGDPFTFGRGGEEIQLLAENQINFQVVPGITSAHGSSAYAGIPLTHRDHAQSCVFVTGHLKDGRPELDWERLILPNQTIAIYMGLSGLAQISQSMIEHGAEATTPVAVIANATRPNQKLVTGTLTTIAEEVTKAGLKSPAMIIVGSVVSLHKELAWFEGSD